MQKQRLRKAQQPQEMATAHHRREITNVDEKLKWVSETPLLLAYILVSEVVSPETASWQPSIVLAWFTSCFWNRHN